MVFEYTQGISNFGFWPS